MTQRSGWNHEDDGLSWDSVQMEDGSAWDWTQDFGSSMNEARPEAPSQPDSGQAHEPSDDYSIRRCPGELMGAAAAHVAPQGMTRAAPPWTEWVLPSAICLVFLGSASGYLAFDSVRLDGKAPFDGFFQWLSISLLSGALITVCLVLGVVMVARGYRRGAGVAVLVLVLLVTPLAVWITVQRGAQHVRDNLTSGAVERISRIARDSKVDLGPLGPIIDWLAG